jgi:hypothetical protein
MECLVCGIDAEVVDSKEDAVEVNCQDCGHFGVSKALIATQAGRYFDVEQTRWWLERRNVAFPTMLPIISDAFVFWGY